MSMICGQRRHAGTPKTSSSVWIPLGRAELGARRGRRVGGEPGAEPIAEERVDRPEPRPSRPRPPWRPRRRSRAARRASRRRSTGRAASRWPSGSRSALPVRLEPVQDLLRSLVLPGDDRGQRLAGLGVPGQHGLALVVEAAGRDVRARPRGARPTAPTTASTITSGSCSTHPGLGWISGFSRRASLTGFRSSSKSDRLDGRRALVDAEQEAHPDPTPLQFRILRKKGLTAVGGRAYGPVIHRSDDHTNWMGAQEGARGNSILGGCSWPTR